MTNKLLVLCSALFIMLSCKNYPKTESSLEPVGAENLAYKWGEIALTATANDTERFKPRPTVTSRYLGLIFISIFDAWSVYDDTAVPVYLKDVKRQAESERTLKQKEIAISYAAFRTLSEYYYSDQDLFRSFMVELGLDPDNTSLDPKTPEGIGNLAAKAVIEARKFDGSNQHGEEPGSDGTPYYDYSNYQPINSPDVNVDIDRWQPKYFSDGKGGKFAPSCLTPFWNKVQPIALQSADQFRPGPPPLVGSEQMEKEVKEVISLQTNLSPEEKALVEFMRDGPQSVQQAGHWLKFAQDVSRRDANTLDMDVKMYFLTQITAMDAFIASWDAKMYYDSARPYALVHAYYPDMVINGWKGREQGWGELKGSEWQPYSPEEFLCPPFPSYVSGHSTISGGCAEALRLFTGDDFFGEEVQLVPGALTEPENVGDTVTIKFPSFTETANLAGISRVMGGYHIQADNVAGLQLGRDVAHQAWKFYLNHIGKTDPKNPL
ncbi:PAP2 superfamily protein [Arenibacter nanhaiticus]|uniref:PAP2 superfamily protein n=1 Tax=Arenibacter nanhaiticus TaxID=558155 RepID=A0A1M6IKS7_9FLAO|nr:vanadium-dependent haloperoxidase [Arenibacter nanhaiticus]SHJ35086.1 PAP2 superfamily protein [Arenibacter nanhaiticus]